MKIIITNSDVGAIIQGSKNILSKYNTNGEIPENIKGQAVLSVLKNLTQNKTYFDICGVSALAKMNDILISAEHYEFMNTLHCIQWNEMHPDTKEYLMALLVDYFKSNMVMANAK
jgi:hypothetical protein